MYKENTKNSTVFWMMILNVEFFSVHEFNNSYVIKT